MLTKTQFTEQLEKLYGWYAALSVDRICRIDVLSLIHGCGKSVYNFTDGKTYMPIEFSGNRIVGEKLLEVKAIEVSLLEQLWSENKNEEGAGEAPVSIPENLCVWLNVHDLYDCCQTDLALSGDILGSLFKDNR